MGQHSRATVKKVADKMRHHDENGLFSTIQLCPQLWIAQECHPVSLGITIAFRSAMEDTNEASARTAFEDLALLVRAQFGIHDGQQKQEKR